MTDLPEWVPPDAKLETIGPRLRVRGKHADPGIALGDFQSVLDAPPPDGYRLSRASIEAEHARGERLNWVVVWLKEEVAERRYREKQATRLSRFEVGT